jgi:hypothetical protein
MGIHAASTIFWQFTYFGFGFNEIGLQHFRNGKLIQHFFYLLADVTLAIATDLSINSVFDLDHDQTRVRVIRHFLAAGTQTER